MKCGHCLVEIHPHWEHHPISSADPSERANTHYLRSMWCAGCGELIVDLVHDFLGGTEQELRIHPHGSARSPAPAEVDDERLVQDYREACLVLPLSAQASAALSRRCLQHIIREKAGIEKPTLYREIEELLESPALPGYIKDNLHAVREIGNVAAHPMKNTTTGEVLPVDPVKAEWNLEVVEALFDFYYVQRARNKTRLDALKKKLEVVKEPGKPG